MNRALIIEKEALELIFSGKKRLELRTKTVNFRETIGLIQKGTKTIVGQVFLAGVLKINPKNVSSTTCSLLCMNELEIMTYGKGRIFLYAYFLKYAKRFRKPIPYRHKNGAVTWVKIS